MLLKCCTGVLEAFKYLSVAQILRRCNVLKRVMVNLTDDQYKLVSKFRGVFGNSDSEIIKYIILSYLSEKTYLKEEIEKD